MDVTSPGDPLGPGLALVSPFARLTCKCPGPDFCLQLKFGQAIMVGVLMLNFLNMII